MYSIHTQLEKKQQLGFNLEVKKVTPTSKPVKSILVSDWEFGLTAATCGCFEVLALTSTACTAGVPSETYRVKSRSLLHLCQLDVSIWPIWLPLYNIAFHSAVACVHPASSEALCLEKARVLALQKNEHLVFTCQAKSQLKTAKDVNYENNTAPRVVSVASCRR